MDLLRRKLLFVQIGPFCSKQKRPPVQHTQTLWGNLQIGPFRSKQMATFLIFCQRPQIFLTMQFEYKIHCRQDPVTKIFLVYQGLFWYQNLTFGQKCRQDLFALSPRMMQASNKHNTSVCERSLHVSAIVHWIPITDCFPKKRKQAEQNSSIDKIDIKMFMGGKGSNCLEFL